MLPLSVAVLHVFPVVMIAYAKGDPVKVLGVPDIVKVVPLTDADTPAGSPVTVAPVAPPDKV